MEKVNLMETTTDGNLKQFLAAKHYAPTSIKQVAKVIRRVDRENLTEDDVWSKYISYSTGLRCQLRRGIRLLEEFKTWEKE